MEHLNEEEKQAIEVVAQVFPFKVNNYVIEELIHWENYQSDPIFHLTFPQKEMLEEEDYHTVKKALLRKCTKESLKTIANEIRMRLNPHPAGQMDLNMPEFNGKRLNGIQHKYRETVLFFPISGQTCHSYCTFCFRWPQFVGMEGLKIAIKESNELMQYLRNHQEVTDILYTGGDPMIMSYPVFRQYIEPFLNPDNGTNIQTIRIGTKVLGYWPYKFLTDRDADDFLSLFRQITEMGIHLSFMAHFNHIRELQTDALREAVKKVRGTGAVIRTQSPVLRHINDNAEMWAAMWKEQVNLGMIPYYMFVERDTGARKYFDLPLIETWEIFQKAFTQVSGVCRTVRGPSMSCTPGKVQILGVRSIPINGKPEKVFVLQMLQGRNPDWAGRPFFALYDAEARWMDELLPAFGQKFFFEDELERMVEERREKVFCA